MRRQIREIRLPLVVAGGDAAGNFREAITERDGFRAGGVEEDCTAGFGVIFGYGEGLIIEDHGTGLSPDGRQAVARKGQSFSDAQLRHGRGPDCGEGDISRLVLEINRAARETTIGVRRAQVGHDRASCWLLCQTRQEKPFLHQVIELHFEGGGLRVIMRTPVDPCGLLAVLESKGAVGER